MKKRIKDYSFGLLSGLFIAAAGIVTATILYNANEVVFNPTDSTWNVNNVEDAINDIKNNYTPNSIVESEYISKSYLEGKTWEFDYTGGIQSFDAVVAGTYKLEVWGASGGDGNHTAYTGSKPGVGGYSVGEIKLSEKEKLFVVVGGEGEYITGTPAKGGYNGGGSSGPHSTGMGGGGGATHIATMSGTLKEIGVSNISKVIMVAGGGGGTDDQGTNSSSAGTSNDGTGGNGGGYIGNSGKINGVAANTSLVNNSAMGGRQNAGASFGQGQNSITTTDCGGGGGGLYGGFASDSGNGGGGGGSGYIGNTRLSNAAMYCKDCATSNADSTKTISISNVEKQATPKTAKKGNGYARITLISID